MAEENKLAKESARAHKENKSLWCNIGKHKSCKGRWFDDNWKTHKCDCECHR